MTHFITYETKFDSLHYANQNKFLLDSDNILHAFYVTHDNKLCRSSKIFGSCWTDAIDLCPGLSASSCSADIDNDNKIHIAFTTLYGSSLCYLVGSTYLWNLSILDRCDEDSIPDICLTDTDEYHIAYKKDGKIYSYHNIDGTTSINLVSMNEGMTLTANYPDIEPIDNNIHCVWTESDGQINYRKATIDELTKKCNWIGGAESLTNSKIFPIAPSLDSTKNNTLQLSVPGLSKLEVGIDTYEDWSNNIENYHVDIDSSPGYAKLVDGETFGYIINELALNFVPINPGEFIGDQGRFVSGLSQTITALNIAYSITDGTTITALTERMGLSGSILPSQANFVRLRISSTAEDGLSISNLSIGERENNTRNVSGNLSYFTFNGARSVILGPSQSVWTDWIPYNIDPNKNYFITYFAAGGLRPSTDGTTLTLINGRYYPNEPTQGYDYSNYLSWSKPNENGIIIIDKSIPIGTGLTHSIVYSNNGITEATSWSDIDNNSTILGNYNYIKLQSGFSITTLTETPVLSKITFKYPQKDYIIDSQSEWNEGTFINTESESSPGDVKHNLGWTAIYNAAVFPESASPAWSLELGLNAVIDVKEIIDNRYLHFKFHTTEVFSSYCYYIRSNIFQSNTNGNTVEIKTKIVSGGAYLCLYFADGTREVYVRFYNDYIRAGYANYYMDTTDDYHIYRITQKGTEVKVYVDNILRITTTNDSAYLNRHQLWWLGTYDGAREGLTYEWYVEYVKYFRGILIPPEPTLTMGTYTTKWIPLSLHPTGFAYDGKWQVVDRMQIRTPSFITYDIKYNTEDNYETASDWNTISSGSRVEPYRYNWIRVIFANSTKEMIDKYSITYFQDFNRIYWNKNFNDSWNPTFSELIKTTQDIDSLTTVAGQTESYIGYIEGGKAKLLECFDGSTNLLSLTTTGFDTGITACRNINDGNIKYLTVQGYPAISTKFALIEDSKKVIDVELPDTPNLQGL